MTDHIGRITLVSFLLLSLPGRGAAQELTAGSNVRVTAPSLGLTEHRGILEWVRGDSLRVGERTIPLGATTRVEIGREVSNFARFSLIGLAGGAALAGIVCLNECPSNDSDIGKGGLHVSLLSGRSRRWPGHRSRDRSAHPSDRVESGFPRATRSDRCSDPR